MNGSVAALLQAARRALQDKVQPDLQGADARAQLAAVVDTLAKLEPMLDWSAAIRDEQDAALRQGIDAVRLRAATVGLQPPAPGASVDHDLRAVSDWLFASVPSGAVRDDLDRLLRTALRDAVAAERRHVRRTDFSSMTESPQP